jgi:uncharacterized protein DUF4276
VRFVLFVEGETERRGVAGFLKRYLDPCLKEPVRVAPVAHKGWSELVKDLPRMALKHLNDPQHSDQTIALFALLDLYGPDFYPGHARTAMQRTGWAKAHFEKLVGHRKFRMFFAVHDIEAWFLSDLSLFPQPIRKALGSKAKNPEGVNFNSPPKKLLRRLYRDRLNQTYKEVTHGYDLFSKLDPSVAAARCPQLRAMLDEMVKLAKAAGL